MTNGWNLIVEIVLIAIALSLDAFSVSISCGIKLAKTRYIKYLKIASAFGIFQAIMPVFGYILSYSFLNKFLVNYSKWITFLVFFLLGIKTLYDYFQAKINEECLQCSCDGFKCLVTLAIATSIDAFLVGAVLGMQNTPMLFSVITIGVITFINSMIGCIMGNKLSVFFREKSRIAAAIILFILAIKPLLD